jgi:hypothetical protein
VQAKIGPDATLGTLNAAMHSVTPAASPLLLLLLSHVQAKIGPEATLGTSTQPCAATPAALLHRCSSWGLLCCTLSRRARTVTWSCQLAVAAALWGLIWHQLRLGCCGMLS